MENALSYLDKRVKGLSRLGGDLTVPPDSQLTIDTLFYLILDFTYAM